MVTASSSASDILFNHETNVAPLGLIAMRGTEELGKKLILIWLNGQEKAAMT